MSIPVGIRLLQGLTFKHKGVAKLIKEALYFYQKDPDIANNLVEKYSDIAIKFKRLKKRPLMINFNELEYKCHKDLLEKMDVSLFYNLYILDKTKQGLSYENN